MSTITSGRLALATSSLALVVAVGGVGYAAATIGTADIKKNAVTSQKIKNGQVTGKDVKESSLAKVPSAATADTATNLAGVSIKEIHYVRTATTGPEAVYSGGGLTLTASCAAGGELSLVATSTATATVSAVVTTDSAGTHSQDDEEDFDLAPGEAFNMLAGTAANITVIDGHFFTRGGDTVTMTLFADETSTECFLAGHAVQS